MSNVTKYVIDSNMLSFIPRSTYYANLSEQVRSVEKSWEDLLKVDRELFSLLMILPGTTYSKGRMVHYLLSTAGNDDVEPVLEDALIVFNLKQMPMSHALRSLMFLAGEDYAGMSLKKVNNTRTRKIIMNYLFDRDKQSLEAMCVKFRGKLAKLLVHAFGQYDLYNLMNLNDFSKLSKYLVGINGATLLPRNECFSAIAFAVGRFDYVTDLGGVVGDYLLMRKFAIDKNVTGFINTLKGSKIPFEVALGFRNTYKLDVDLSSIHKEGHKSERGKLKTREASKRVGVDTKVDYAKQSLEDLYKYVYLKTIDQEDDSTDTEEAYNALADKMTADKPIDIDFGDAVVIIDTSASMEGDETRKYHPIVTANIIANRIPNCKLYVFSNPDNRLSSTLVKPSGETELWRCLIEATKQKPDTIIVISDGYENTVGGMFEYVYAYLRNEGILSPSVKLIHINPVYDAEVRGGKRLVSSIEPIAVANADLFQSQYVIHTLTEGNVVEVKQLLRNMAQAKLGGSTYELIARK